MLLEMFKYLPLMVLGQNQQILYLFMLFVLAEVVEVAEEQPPQHQRPMDLVQVEVEVQLLPNL